MIILKNLSRISIIFLTIVLTGCSPSSEVEAKVVQVNELMSEVSVLESKLQVLEEEKKDLIKRQDDTLKANSTLEEANNSLKIKNDTLESSIETLEKNKVEMGNIEKELNSLKAFFEQSTDVNNRRIILNEEILNKNDAKKLYFEAQKYYQFRFFAPAVSLITPKDKYKELYEDIEGKIALEQWYLINNDGVGMTKQEFIDEIKEYFSMELLDTFDSYFFDLGDGNSEVDLEGTQYYGVFNDKVYARLFGGLSTSETQILRDYCNLTIEHISTDGMKITYKFVMPIVHYDIYLNEFKRIEIIEEIVEFKKGSSGWRVNSIPLTFEE